MSWVTDSNDNRCSTEFFGSEAAAQAALDSLAGCAYCTNCEDCEGCYGCKECTGCVRCNGLVGVDNRSDRPRYKPVAGD